MTFVDYHNGPNLGLEPSDEHVSVVGMPEFDALLDHIYEHGTTSEGVRSRADALARALLARYGQPAASVEPVAAVVREHDGRAFAVLRPAGENLPDGTELYAAIGAAQAQPKRRPYNASASLSEYGIFPECDAAPAAQPAASAEPAAQAPAADAHPGYAGVTVWVGDMKCTMAVPKQILKASRYDALLECFQKARRAIDAQRAKEE